MGHFAIIGGAGFIGSHFIDYLASTGNKITVVDNLCSGSKSRIEAHLSKPYLKLIEMDVRDTKGLIFHLQDVDTVIHLASNPDIARAATEPRIDFNQGTVLTESVLEACRISEVGTVLYASGSGVYGGSGMFPLCESSFLQPISTYGASKLAGEALLSSYSFMFGLKCIAFRFANVVGPRQTHGVGYDFVRKLRNNPEKLEVLGNGTQTKSYIHVIDVVSAVIAANERIVSGYDVFNVATEDFLTVKDIVEIVLSELEMNKNDVKVVYSESDRGWKADVPKIILNSSKIRNLGWSNSLSSGEAMRHAIRSLI